MTRYWHWDKHAEEIPFEDPQDAIDDYVEESGEIPNSLTLYGFDPMPITDVPNPDNILDMAWEDIEEEHGSPYEPMKPPTDRARAAAKEFVQILREEYGDSYWSEHVVTQEFAVEY